MGLFLEHYSKFSKAGVLPFGMLIVLGRLHIMPISKYTYSNCAVLHVLIKCPKFSEIYVHYGGIAHLQYHI